MGLDKWTGLAKKLLGYIVTAVMSACIKRNLSILVNFCVAILILKMEKIQNAFSILCFIISRKGKTQLKCKKKKRCVQCMEKGL